MSNLINTDKKQRDSITSTSHVVIQVPDTVASLLENPETDYSFQDLDTKNPVMIVGERRLCGVYKTVVGTNLGFEPSRSENAGFVGAATRYLVFSDEVSV